MERYRSRANDKSASLKTRIKYNLKCVNIASKHAFMGDRKSKAQFLTKCYQNLCLLYHQRDKLEKAIYFNNKIILKYLVNEKDQEQYYRYKFILALVFGDHNTINNVTKLLHQSNFADKHLWYYTYRLIDSVMIHKYQEADVWCQRGRKISINDATKRSVRISFEIWTLYLKICMNELNKENENAWNEIILSIREQLTPLSDVAIMGIVYIALILTKYDVLKIFRQNVM
eukprot:55473_1